MTQLREAQDELLRKETLATIAQLASSRGHDLRNALGGRAQAVDILERPVESPPPKAKHYLQLLTAQIRLSERIVADLLDSARSQAPQRRRTDVHALLTEQLGRVNISW